MDDVDELAIEVNGAFAGLRVHDFAPETNMFSDIANEIETTTTTKKARSLDGSLGGTLPVPGVSDAVHISRLPFPAVSPIATRLPKKSTGFRPSTRWSSAAPRRKAGECSSS